MEKSVQCRSHTVVHINTAYLIHTCTHNTVYVPCSIWLVVSTNLLKQTALCLEALEASRLLPQLSLELDQFYIIMNAVPVCVQ